MYLIRWHKGRSFQGKAVEMLAAVHSLTGYTEGMDDAQDMAAAAAEHILRLAAGGSSCSRDILVVGCMHPVRVVSSPHFDVWNEGNIRHDHDHRNLHKLHHHRDL